MWRKKYYRKPLGFKVWRSLNFGGPLILITMYVLFYSSVMHQSKIIVLSKSTSKLTWSIMFNLFFIFHCGVVVRNKYNCVLREKLCLVYYVDLIPLMCAIYLCYGRNRSIHLHVLTKYYKQSIRRDRVL